MRSPIGPIPVRRKNAACLLWIALCLSALASLGCDTVVETTGNIAFDLIEEIEERNAAAAQARMDLRPRSDTSRTSMERSALRIANGALSGRGSKVKEAFCGSPPNLSHLPPKYFKFEPSAYIPADTPVACRAAADRKFPNLESCYLIFDNGSTAYINCFNDPKSAAVSCISIGKLLWEIAWNEDLRKDCKSD